jgi:hypothetical protein
MAERKGTRKSGWCLGAYPANKAQHDKCPVNFTTNSCPCDCGHVGEKPKGWNNGHLVTGLAEKASKKADETPLKVDKPAQTVYAKSVPQPRQKAEGADEKLKALYT